MYLDGVRNVTRSSINYSSSQFQTCSKNINKATALNQHRSIDSARYT